MKRTLSFALAFLAVASLAACGGNTADTANTEQVTAAEPETTAPETAYIDTLEERDMQGTTFTTVAQNTASRQSFYMEELEGDMINDAIYERNMLTEERLNLKLVDVADSDRNKVATMVINAVTAGDNAYDMIFNCLSQGINTCMNAGVLYNLKNIPYISLENSLYWNKSMYSNMQIFDKLYFTSGAVAQTLYRSPIVVAYNKELADDYKIENLYQCVLNGKWTVDKMYSLFKDVTKDLNGDSVLDDKDQWGLIIDGTWGNALYTGAGYDTKEVTADGQYRLTLGDEKAVNLVEKCASLFGDRKIVLNDLNGSKDYQENIFKVGRALFCDMTVSVVMSMRDMEDDFGILPNPKYTEAQEEYYTACNTWLPSGVAVPLLCNDADRTGLIMETLAYYSYEKLVPAVYDVTLRGKAARDSESWLMLDIIFENATFDFNTVLSFGGSSELFRAAACGETENWVSTWASVRDSAQTALDKVVAIAKEEK